MNGSDIIEYINNSNKKEEAVAIIMTWALYNELIKNIPRCKKILLKNQKKTIEKIENLRIFTPVSESGKHCWLLLKNKKLHFLL